MRKTFEPIMIEDVYHQLMTGTASLFLVRVEGLIEGYFILQALNRRGVKCAHIWAIYNSGAWDLVPVVARYVDDLARNMGAQRASFITSRKKWERRIGTLGYHPKYIEFVKDYP